jgi:hypothetical protein
MVWHKLYSSTQRSGFPEKATKDRVQALTLAAALADQEHGMLEAAFNDAPAAMTGKVKRLVKPLIAGASAHPPLCDSLSSCLKR